MKRVACTSLAKIAELAPGTSIKFQDLKLAFTLGMLKSASFFVEQHGFPPTDEQYKFLKVFEAFMGSKKERCTLILNGYAGTGKTTLLATCAKFLDAQEKSYVLMAPTGRAAKVISNYSSKKAFTIHRIIYALRKRRDGGQYFSLRKNTYKNTVFIVDESSMIGEEGGGFSKQSLLDDIVEFVFSSPGCRLIFVGDEAQLPPVGSSISPALNKELLEQQYQLVIAKVSLSQVLRQAKESGILLEATRLRGFMQEQDFKMEIALHHDLRYLSHYDFADHYQEHLNHYGEDNVIYITRSNKQANRMNMQIRNFVYGSDALVDGGDKIMVVKNNYHWVGLEDSQDFIANGDFCKVVQVRNQDEVYGYQFADATLEFPDYNLHLDAKIWLDCLLVEQASMPAAASEKIWSSVDESLFDEFPEKKKRIAMLRQNSFVQALQIKFG
ncbi:MAG: ATP-dependent DNA helicase, partial [Luteibaculum sp.]